MYLSGKPLVSVVIPSYNHSSYVKESIVSVINQDYENIELIIIDDGSTDESVSFINELVPQCRSRFKRFEFLCRENMGLGATLNQAIRWCEGVFLSCIASDDMYQRNKTSIQVEYLLKNENASGVFGGIDVLYNDGNTRELSWPSKKYNFDDIFLHNHHLPAPTSLLRISDIKESNLYLEDNIIEDWSMWLQLTKKGKTLDLLEQVFSVYRRHGNNTSLRFDDMQEARINIINMYDSHPLYIQALARAYEIGAKDSYNVDRVKSEVFLEKANALYASLKI